MNILEKPIKLGKRIYNSELKVTMNITEYIFYKWLKRHNPHSLNIVYNAGKNASPDFIINSKEGYEVKRLEHKRKDLQTGVKMNTYQFINLKEMSKNIKIFYSFVDEVKEKCIIVPIEELDVYKEAINGLLLYWNPSYLNNKEYLNLKKIKQMLIQTVYSLNEKTLLKIKENYKDSNSLKKEIEKMMEVKK